MWHIICSIILTVVCMCVQSMKFCTVQLVWFLASVAWKHAGESIPLYAADGCVFENRRIWALRRFAMMKAPSIMGIINWLPWSWELRSAVGHGHHILLLHLGGWMVAQASCCRFSSSWRRSNVLGNGITVPWREQHSQGSSHTFPGHSCLGHCFSISSIAWWMASLASSLALCVAWRTIPS